MTKQDRNKVAMFLTVLLWLKEKLSQLTTLPNYTEVFDEFEAFTKEIALLDSGTVTGTQGATEDKGFAKSTLSRLTLTMVVRIKAYAVRLKDHLLLNSIDFTKTQLYYASDQVLMSRATHIRTVAEGIGDKALAYGLTPETLSELSDVEDAFKARVSNPRKTLVEKSGTGEEVRAKVDETDNYVKEQVDSLLELAGNTQPELYNQYLAARVIIDR
jgi:hypothetical protein